MESIKVKSIVVRKVDASTRKVAQTDKLVFGATNEETKEFKAAPKEFNFKANAEIALVKKAKSLLKVKKKDLYMMDIRTTKGTIVDAFLG